MRTLNQRTQNMRTLNQRTLKSTYTKKSLCVDTKNFLAFTQKLGQTHKRTQKFSTLNTYASNLDICKIEKIIINIWCFPPFN